MYTYTYIWLQSGNKLKRLQQSSGGGGSELRVSIDEIRNKTSAGRGLPLQPMEEGFEREDAPGPKGRSTGRWAGSGVDSVISRRPA